MDINRRFELLGQLIGNPPETWKLVRKQDFSVKQFRNEFMFPAIGIFVLAQMVGMLIDAESQFGPNWFIVVYSIVIGFGLYFSYYLSVFLMRFLLKSFEYKGKTDFLYWMLGLPLIIGYVPIEITVLFQSMFFLILLSIYAFVVFWFGTQKLVKLASDKKQVFGILSIVFSIAAHVFVFFLIHAIRRPIIELF
ncbi:MAG: hypothetical protein PF448_03640 [Bacteroidales bacterium]|jgi:hypothetical protein|nr:hypothetical protein [Bacteroidales bacterium]